MTYMSRDGLGKEIPLVWLPQMVGPTFNRHLVHLCIAYKFAFSPPEGFTALDVPWNQKDRERNLQLADKCKSMRIVIVVAVVKGQYQQRTLITSILSMLERSIQFFQSLFQMQHAVVTPQIEEMATQIPPSCTVVREDNQALPRVPPPPACQFYQPAVVETCSQ